MMAARMPATESAGMKGERRSSLTQREQEVLKLLAQGLTTSQISQRLAISPKTTRNHLTSIYEKLDVTSRTQAVLQALARGLVN
jgi:DNA-binding CsgD family transcriptional regulator